MAFDPSEAALLVALGLAVASYGSVVGAGGGFLLVPLLLLLDPGESPRIITTISLAVVAVNGVSATLAYARMRRIDFRSGILLSVSSIPGAVAGAWATRFVPRGLFDLLFGLLLVVLAGWLLFPSRPAARLSPPATGWMQRELTDASGTTYFYAFNRWIALVIGIAGGLIGTVAGIGGGILVVPSVVAWLHFPVHVATATSAFVFMVSALTGTMTHLIAGDFEFDIEQILFLAVGVVLGAQIGARVSERLSRGVIMRLLAIGIGLIGVRLVLASFSILSLLPSPSQ